jgi:hypothetical protein
MLLAGHAGDQSDEVSERPAGAVGEGLDVPLLERGLEPDAVELLLDAAGGRLQTGGPRPPALPFVVGEVTDDLAQAFAVDVGPPGEGAARTAAPASASGIR